ncbi:MAG: Uma2 family endonuclease [Pirellulaceae bacterium]|nr:Uma2 family endonuclease [Pirellulaceae bacterium]
MSIANKPMTAQQFAAIPAEGRSFELVEGKLVEMNRPKPRHGKIVFRIARIVGQFVDNHDLGHWFGGDAGIVTMQDPDTVRGPDAAFASYERIPREADDDHYFLVAPELVFEVLSPSDRWVDVLDKVSEYLHAGVDAVCLLDPIARTLQIHRSKEPPAVRNETDSFELAEILPGFQCQVAEFFPPRNTP